MYNLALKFLNFLWAIGINFDRLFGRFSRYKRNTISKIRHDLGRFTFLPIFFCIIVKMAYVYGIHITGNCKKSGFSSFGNMGVLCNDLVYCAFTPLSSGNKFKKNVFLCLGPIVVSHLVGSMACVFRLDC